jgi:hypothetical protein
MTFDRKKYPGYWRQFSLYVRKERAGDKCENCGAKNGDIKYSFSFGVYFVNPNKPVDGELEALMSVHRFRKSRVVLTVAHLDYAGGVCRCRGLYGFKCAKPSHVLALCQACHLAIDRPKHLAVQAKNRAARKDSERGLLNLF